MDNRTLVIVLGLVVFGLVFGALTARSSEKRLKIYGGSMSRLFNYLASSAMTALAPTALISIFVFRLEILQIVLVVAGIFAITFIFITLHAIIEKPALEQMKPVEDRGWTEQDAKTSGL